LLTISDVMPGNGVEHGSSSDDGTGGDGLTETRSIAGTAGLLSHEFNHSWDGKYRRPADLATNNFQVPEQTELLWIYEGMTQFYGDLVPVRAGFTTPSRFRDNLAGTWARLDHEVGRNVRPLLDTAAAAPYLYEAPRGLGNERRSAGDFYSEGELLWLDVDAQLLAMSGGTKSLDGFCKTFFGLQNTPSMVNPYTYEQFVAALNAYQAYDWDGYFKKAVYAVAPHPPSAFEKLGWKLVYTNKASADAGDGGGRFGRGISEPYTLGMNGGANGTLTDVFPGMPAAKGGLGFGDTIVAVNGREFSAQVLDEAIKAAKGTTAPLVFIVKKGGNYRTVSVDYHDGPKHPHLVRVEGTPDLLSTIVAPKRPGAPAPTPEPKATPDDSH
jgi:predicted metalloprotease with PDZ domain